MGKIQIRGHIDGTVCPQEELRFLADVLPYFWRLLYLKQSVIGGQAYKLFFLEKIDFLFPAVVQLRYQKS